MRLQRSMPCHCAGNGAASLAPSWASILPCMATRMAEPSDLLKWSECSLKLIDQQHKGSVEMSFVSLSAQNRFSSHHHFPLSTRTTCYVSRHGSQWQRRQQCASPPNDQMAAPCKPPHSTKDGLLSFLLSPGCFLLSLLYGR